MLKEGETEQAKAVFLAASALEVDCVEAAYNLGYVCVFGGVCLFEGVFVGYEVCCIICFIIGSPPSIKQLLSNATEMCLYV